MEITLPSFHPETVTRETRSLAHPVTVSSPCLAADSSAPIEKLQLPWEGAKTLVSGKTPCPAFDPLCSPRHVLLLNKAG